MDGKKKRNRINRMNIVAEQVRLGDMIPIIARRKLADGDIDEDGVFCVDAGMDIDTICSVWVSAADGTVRPAAKAAVVDKPCVQITAQGAKAGDVAVVMIL